MTKLESMKSQASLKVEETLSGVWSAPPLPTQLLANWIDIPVSFSATPDPAPA